jgi:glutamine---fructose-6-phosphate transaminase (isomerizing)
VGYEHFMLKEIHEQPDSLANAIRGRLDFNLGSSVLSGMGTSPRELAELTRVVLVGCGTSLHAGLVGEYAFEDLADIHAEVQQAAEFRYRNPILGSRDLVVAISQSGETADTLAAVREANQKGAFVMSLCNVVGSTIARETGRGVYLHAGPEISVASTKAFTCQVAVLLMMALKLGRGRRFSREEGIRSPARSRASRNSSPGDRQDDRIARNRRILRATTSTRSSSAAARCIRWRSKARSNSRKSPTSTPKAIMPRN